MKLSTLLDQLSERNIRIDVSAGKLKVYDPQQQLNQVLTDALRRHKPALLELFHQGDGYTQSDFRAARLGSTDIARLQADYPLLENLYITTPMQDGMLFHGLLDGSGASYTTQTQISLSGDLDVAAFIQAWDQVIRRHAVLRTCFVGLETEQPHQLVLSQVVLPVTELDWRQLSADQQQQALKDFIREDRARGFDFSVAPLMRIALLRMADSHYQFIWSNHHSVLDGWCKPTIFTEVLSHYHAASTGVVIQQAEAVPYENYIAWLARQDKRQAKDFWRGQLEGVQISTPLGFETQSEDRPADQARDYAFELDQATTDGLSDLARKCRCTMNVIVQAAWSYLLHRYSGEQKVVFGATVSGRPASLPGVEKMIGLFINTIPVGVEYSDDLQVGDLLNRLHKENIQREEHSYLSLSEIQALSSIPNHGNLFDSIIVFENYPIQEKLRTADDTNNSVAVDSVSMEVQNNFKITLTVSHRSQLKFIIRYNACQFSEQTIARISSHLLSVLNAILAEGAAAPIASLSYLSGDEQQHLKQLWQGPEDLNGRDLKVHEIFEAQTDVCADDVAVRCSSKFLTYRQLDEQANRLACYLQEQEVGPGDYVGLYVNRSVELLVGQLAVLKTGAAYIPLEPGFSRERLAEIVEQTGLEWMLSETGLVDDLPLSGIDVLMLDEALSKDGGLAGYSAASPAVEIDWDACAYVIYTSGSSGRPKGVAVNHRGLTDYCAFALAHYYEPDLAGSLLVTSHSFDISLPSLYLPLLKGGCVTLLAADQVMDELTEHLSNSEDKNFLLRMTPSHGQLLLTLLPENFEDRRKHVFVIGGESLSRELANQLRRCFPEAIIYNHYGPTETVVGCCIHRFEAGQSLSHQVPIGRPMSNTSCVVLDRVGHPVPAGIVGELYIGGPCVSLGYVNQPDLTADRFVELEIEGDSQRYYRTGDLVRWNSKGELEFVGRGDNQVKLRGFRIELGEIESALRSIANVDNAAVTVIGEDTEDQLAAFLVLSDGLPESEEQQADRISRFRSILGEKLPAYMLPDVWVFLDELPLTLNGKIDRNALPQTDHCRVRSTAYLAPRSETEIRLSAIWSEVLKVDQIGVEDHFFELGGHSLLATRLISLVRQEFDTELPLKALFDHPTIASLASCLEQQDSVETLPAITRSQQRTNPPLSFAQQRMWFIDQLEGGSVQYNLPKALRLVGQLDRSAFERALAALIERHELLRSCIGEEQGQAVQSIRSTAESPLTVVDLRTCSDEEKSVRLTQSIEQDLAQPFDLKCDLPMRVQLLLLAEDEQVVLFNMHHIASDGWSMRVMLTEFSHLYTAFASGETDPLPSLALQYGDYARWQRDWLQGDVLSAQLEYWTTKLADIPQVHNLPMDHTRPARQSFLGKAHYQSLDETLSNQFRELCLSRDSTLFIGLQTAFSVLLARYSGDTDIVMGTPVSGRTHQEVEPLIGLFVNTLVLRSRISPDDSFASLLASNREMLLEAYNHQHIPFEMLVDAIKPERSLSHSPLFQITFTLQNSVGESLDLPGLTAFPMPRKNTVSRFDLELTAEESASGLRLKWLFNPDLFEMATIERMAANFDVLLQAVVGDPTKDLKDVVLLSNRETQQVLVDWNDTQTDFPDDLCIHQLIEAQAARDPEAVALICDSRQLSYAALNARANQLARHLLSLGVGPNHLVGLCMDRSMEMIIGILAVLKAGGAYLPLDPTYPADRLQFMLDDSDAAVVLIDQDCPIDAYLENRTAITLNESCWESFLKTYPATNIEPSEACPSARNLAYVIYTSGSTGRPKGVMLEHRGLVNLVLQQATELNIGAGNRMLQFASISFDAAVWEWSTALASGAALVLDRQVQDIDHCVRLLTEQRISHALFSASFLNVLPEGALRNMQCLVTGGEACPVQLAQKIESDVPLINAYGPTENTVIATTHRYSGSSRFPIGRPIDNTQVWVLDQQMVPVPIGVTGELYIGGTGLARGYLNQPELTARHFVANPFSEYPESRLYRTGDLARWLADGQLEFLGRNDHQVKVRGFRIELWEIEHSLLDLEVVKEAVVIVREDHAGIKQLVAYISPETGLPDEDLKQHCIDQLKQRLPFYMLPAVWVVMPQMPVNASGKLDRKALPEPLETDLQRAEYVAPEGKVQTQLCEIWQQVLRLKRVGIDDNFFALGGDSILCIQVVSRARSQGLSFSVRDLFECQTIAELEGRVRLGKVLVAAQGNVVGDMPLLPIQSLFFSWQLPDQHHFNQSILLEVPAEFKYPQVSKIMAALYRRHDALRLRFRQVGSEWTASFQEYDDAMLQASVERYDLSAVETQQRRPAIETHCQQLQTSLDLENGPLMKAAYFDCGEAPGRLLLVIHHLVVDGVSWRIVLADIESAYRQLLQQKPVTLADKTSSYQQWANGLIALAESGELEQQRAYWLDRLSLPVARLEPAGEGAVPTWNSMSFRLPEQETKLLIGECSQAYRTTINELLLTAFIAAYRDWRSEPTVRIRMEGHGRDSFSEELDVTDTVGWFTCIYPAVFTTDDSSNDIGYLIKQVKEQYRALPENKSGFGLLTQVLKDRELLELDRQQQGMVISFNYLGQLDNALSSDQGFSMAAESKGETHSPKQQRQDHLSVISQVINDQLMVSLTYSAMHISAHDAESLRDGFERQLKNCVDHCMAINLTKSDFYIDQPPVEDDELEEFLV